MNRSIMLLFLLLFSLPSFAQLEEMATVVDANGETNATMVDWDYHDVPVNQEEGTVRKYAGRVPLTRLNTGKYKVKIEGEHCAYEKNEFVAYVIDSETRCKYILGEETLSYRITINANFFNSKPDPQCREMFISINPKIKSPPPGFFSMACEQSENGFRLTVNHSKNFTLSQSRLHESYGKYENFKTWDFIGLGKLASKKDLILNRFVLTDKETKKKQTITIRRKAFKFVRTSPFEVNVGLGIASVNFKNDRQGETGVTFLRANVGLAYVVSKWLFKLDTSADVIGLEGNEDPAKSAYFFYQSDIIFGYRWQMDSKNVIEFLPGATFGKYSFQFGQSRRLYTMQGVGGKILYKQVDRNLTDFFGQLSYVNYLSNGNSSLELKAGTRLFSSKFTLWASYGLQNLESSGSLFGPDEGEMIVLGTSLDF